MGVFEKIFGKKGQGKAARVDTYFQMLDGYTPVFTSYDGGVYEMELTRACIHSFANHCSKLLPTVEGADLLRLQRLLNGKPNIFMTSSQFLYKLATIYEAQNTAFIVPVLDRSDRIIGFYPVLASSTEVIEVNGDPWLRYTFQNGDKAALELEKVGTVSKYLYRNDIMGESNAALNPTMQLLHTQNEGIETGIKNAASFRFMANIANFAKADDIKKEREKFVAENFGPKSGGLALFPNTYTNVQQIKSNLEIVDPEQVELIERRVFSYFGTNLDIIQNKADGETWAAYYEGKIEPFAIQLSQAMTCMCFTVEQMSRGNAITWSANRLAYMSTRDKLDVSSQLFDRGILSTNMVMDIWQLPHVPDGDKRYIRKEYIDVEELGKEELTEEPEIIPEPEPAPDSDEGGNESDTE